MKISKRYSPEVRERAVRLVFDLQKEDQSHWTAIQSRADKIGCTHETSRRWVRQPERDQGKSQSQHRENLSVFNLNMTITAHLPGQASSVLDTDRTFLRETLIGSRFLLCYTKNTLALPSTIGGLVMTRIAGLTFVVALLALASGCSRTPESAAGFRLPDGDPIAGRQEFIYLQCHQCHTIPGENFTEIPGVDPPYVALGGNVTRVKTYGELVSAIINPSHELAKGHAKEAISENGVSRMNIYNDVMTVRQLTDLVVFLQPHYDVVVPKYQYRRYR